MKISPKDLEHIIEPLRPFAVPIEAISQDSTNARKHSERNVQAILASIRRFGQRIPVVVNEDGVIEKGNGTHEAMLQGKMKFIAAVQVKDSPSDRTAFSIADNKTSDLSEFDFQALSIQFKALKLEAYPLEVTGFADFEIEPLLEADWISPARGDLPEKSMAVHRVDFSPEQWKRIEPAIAKIAKVKETTEAEAVVKICELWGKDK